MLKLAITSRTPDYLIDAAITYPDMRREAKDRRDVACRFSLVPMEHILESHHIDGVDVLWSPQLHVAWTNSKQHPRPNSLLIEDAQTPHAAAIAWRKRTLEDAS